MTECTPTSFTFADHSRRQVVARFDGGTISSDGGGVLLRQLEQSTGIVRQFADCFRDYRQPRPQGLNRSSSRRTPRPNRPQRPLPKPLALAT